MRVFVAEDDPIILSGFSLMVQSMGYEIVGQAVDGERALHDIIELQPDLVLMDINLPKLDGISVLESVHSISNIPCIIITGYRNEKQIERASSAGAYAYLHKPVDEYELQAAIKIVLNRSKDYNTLDEERRHALQSLEERKLVERAKAILMRQMNLPEPDAFRALQKKSRDNNLKLADMSKRIIDAYELLK